MHEQSDVDALDPLQAAHRPRTRAVRGEARARRTGPNDRADDGVPARAWPLPARRRARPGQDPRGRDAGRARSAATSRASSSRPTSCPPTSSARRCSNRPSGTFNVALGPVFHNFVLADEINRAPAKVQSALLEVMSERQVSIGGVTYPRTGSLPRARDAEPDRVRGRVPAARSAARPVPPQGARAVPHAHRGARDHQPHGRRTRRRRAPSSSPTELQCSCRTPPTASS